MSRVTVVTAVVFRDNLSRFTGKKPVIGPYFYGYRYLFSSRSSYVDFSFV